MSSLKQNIIQQKKEVERKESEKIELKRFLKTFSLFPIVIVIYVVAIIILYKKGKITWLDTGGLVLEKWAYISLIVITVLVIFNFTALLIGTDETWGRLFFKSVEEIELLVKEIQKTNPEILERLEKGEKEN